MFAMQKIFSNKIWFAGSVILSWGVMVNAPEASAQRSQMTNADGTTAPAVGGTTPAQGGSDRKGTPSTQGSSDGRGTSAAQGSSDETGTSPRQDNSTEVGTSSMQGSSEGTATTPGGSTPESSDAAQPGDTGTPPPAVPATSLTTAPKAPVGNGKPLIGIQMCPPKQLAYFLRINEPASRIRIKSAEMKCRQRFIQAGMDPNISIDDAMALGKPVINIYLKKSVGQNILAHGFCMEAFLCQYQRRPTGKVDLVRYVRIGESPEVYSGADFEDKVVMLVDAYLSARHHQIKEASAAQKKSKSTAKGKKTK